MRIKLAVACGALLLLASASVVLAAEPTAFALVKAGDKYVGDESKDKVVQIRSERSAGTLTPNIWYVVYYDPAAPLKAVEVKFGGGQMMSVSQPFRLLEPISGADRVLEPTRLKVDSDRALSIASSQPLLSGVTLSSAKMWLEHGDEGPRWRVQLWAFKISNHHQVDVGSVFIASDTGTVIKSELHPDSVN